MVKSLPAPKVRHPQFLIAPTAYAVILVALVVVQLMGVGGFDFGGISYHTPGEPWIIAVLAGLQIFSLPFLLRLKLSVFARGFSALFSLITPVFVWLEIVYLISTGDLPANWYAATASIALIVLGKISFMVLDGSKAIGFSKK